MFIINSAIKYQRNKLTFKNNIPMLKANMHTHTYVHTYK